MNLSNLEDNVNLFWAKQAQILRSSFVNTIIIVANIIIFAYCFFTGTDPYSRFALDSEIISSGAEQYRLVTGMFLHASMDHLFSNMLILFFVGANVEYDLGHFSYLLLYFISGIIGNIASVFMDVHSMTFSSSIGASGAVFGVVGAVIIIVFSGRKNLKQKGSTLMGRLAFMVFFSIYSGFAAEDINNAAHIGGLLGGAVFTLLITLIGRKQYTMEEWI